MRNASWRIGEDGGLATNALYLIEGIHFSKLSENRQKKKFSVARLFKMGIWRILGKSHFDFSDFEPDTTLFELTRATKYLANQLWTLMSLFTKTKLDREFFKRSFCFLVDFYFLDRW